MIRKLLLVIFFLSLSAASTPAQHTPEQAVINARDQFFDIKKRSIELERMKREADKKPVSKDFTLKFPKIKEDFEQIQKATNEFFQLITAPAPTDYAAVLKLVSEINHRAERLKSNLFSSESKEKKPKSNQQTIQSQDIKILFSNLDKSVNSFAHNPIFQNLNLVNLDDSLQAQTDLEIIIAISSVIKEKAKKLTENDFEN